jgi:hypothetical protein
LQLLLLLRCFVFNLLPSLQTKSGAALDALSGAQENLPPAGKNQSATVNTIVWLRQLTAKVHTHCY